MIIISSRYSITISKLIGTNPIAVLATLILMSYNKILKVIIETLSSVKLDYPNGEKVPVWLKDANIPYLQSKHLTLSTITSFILLVLFIPYTILLLIGPCLYRVSYRRCNFLMKRIKPLLDSYYAPYKKNTRYWTGFLLLVRCVLYIVFSFNSLGGTNKSLLAIIITFTLMEFIFWYPRGIYDTEKWMKIKTKVVGYLKNMRTTTTDSESEMLATGTSTDSVKTVTETVIALREPLLEDSVKS